MIKLVLGYQKYVGDELKSNATLHSKYKINMSCTFKYIIYFLQCSFLIYANSVKKFVYISERDIRLLGPDLMMNK